MDDKEERFQKFLTTQVNFRPPALARNFIDNQWRKSNGSASWDVMNPATAQKISATPLSTRDEVDEAVRSARRAYQEWRYIPAGDRVQFLFKLKALLEEHFEELAAIITAECGKTLAESRGEMRRAIENTEAACGVPLLMQGCNSENIAKGIDEMMTRQPLGIVGIIAPFNFPAMIPFWFFPYALACGNACVIKPSERVPLTMIRVCELLQQTGLPSGVVNLVHGASEVVDAMLEHPQIQAISFVGSSTVARKVYAKAAATGKRVQCQGGAKNPVVILPDCDLDMASGIIADSAFGCAGQRCLAASIAVTVGTVHDRFLDAIAKQAASRVLGNGMSSDVEMGPVISAASQQRIGQLVEQGLREGARAVVDGRNPRVAGCENGYFVAPTVLSDLDASNVILRTEVFGPVLSVLHVSTVDEAIALVNSGEYGNMACLFTSNGSAARKFRVEVEAGNIGINLGVAAPIAQFPFSGWKGSFFGDLHGQGMDAVQFFTQQKVVIERWPSEWSRKF